MSVLGHRLSNDRFPSEMAQAAGLTAAFVDVAALLLVIATCSGMATGTPADTDRSAGG